MGKWTCRCGQAMNDHKAPDPNAYSVYSDELFEEIFNNTDEHDRISYEDISEASFYMWKCANCGSFMVFGEELIQVVSLFMSARQVQKQNHFSLLIKS